MIACIPPTLDGWVYIEPIHGPLVRPLYTWAQYTPTQRRTVNQVKHVHILAEDFSKMI